MMRTEAKAQSVFRLLLTAVLAAGLLLAQPAQAQTDLGVSTTQTVHPNYGRAAANHNR